ncbi:tho complex subunit 2-like [Stylonychia lemnae]|uniref:THO complex subunit 2 n=1 Tax=Stylonychia lemnae TaxID=5949 RepID=A0A078AD57_STYLE|nr:tho complex subunit 2-like [Stylonychia lemnae]|eukprot:CDW79776.1 tho complex subunit 2-like [Stylonychia lemnae]
MHVNRVISVDLDGLAKLISYYKNQLQSSIATSTGYSIQVELEAQLIEIISLKFQNIQSTQTNQQLDIQMKTLTQVVQYLHQQQILSIDNLVRHMDEQTLSQTGLLDSNNYKNKFRRAVTQFMYEQQKFNLLREENEGFAKLIVELNQPNINQSNIDIVKKNVEAMIGFFNLDPNRVMDIILDSYENNMQNEAYLILLKDPQFNAVSIAQVMGFKFQSYLEQLAKSSTTNNNTAHPPQSLFNLTAVLIKNKIITFDDIWPHLGNYQESKDSKELDEVEVLLNKQLKLAQFHYKSMYESIMDREAYEKTIKQRILEKEEVEKLRSQMPLNFRLKLLESFVRINQWGLVDEIIGRFYDYKLDLTLSSSLLSAMFEQLLWFIEPIYGPLGKAKHFKNTNTLKASGLILSQNEGEFQQASTPAIFFDNILQILKPLGVYLAYDQKIFYKLCVIIKQHFSINPRRSIQIAGELFLPALALVEENNEISELIWSILSNIDYTLRYEFYTQMITQTYISSTALIVKMVEVQEGIRQWQKRLSIETVKLNARQLAKLASGNALIVMNTVLSYAKNYRNMIEAQIQSLSLFGPLQLDMVAFSLVRLISDSPEQRLDSEANPNDWLQNLAEYSALFFKKYCQVDMVGLLTYLLNKMRYDNEFNEMIILKEVIAKMFGWSQFNVNEMTPSQLQALAGGIVLRLEHMSQYNNFKRTQKSSDALQNLFWQRTNDKPLSLAFRLMANLAKMTQYIQNSVQTDQMMLISTLLDRMQFTFIQFVESLNYLEYIPSKYAQIWPASPEKVLTVNYKLPPQYVFQILRGGLKKIQHLTDDEFDQKVHEFKSVLDLHYQIRVDEVTDEKDQESEYWDERAFLTQKRDEIWRCLNPKLYCIFWYLQLQSLLVPNDSYSEQIKKVQLQMDQSNNQQTSNNKKNNKEIERLKATKKNLEIEHKDYQNNFLEIDEFLAKQLPKCFETIEDDFQVNWSTVFIQHCLYPRIMFSATDSLYAINFIKKLHKHKVPNFNILSTLGQILKSVAPTIHCCTEEESQNLGVFFLELFQLIDQWQKPDIWDRDCKNYSGFAKLIGSTQSIKLSEFQQIVESIHKRFAQNLIMCFQNGKQQIKTKCGLTILNKMSPIFPNQYYIAKVLQKHLQNLVGQKAQIDNMLWTLAFQCNQNLLKKMDGMEKPASVIEQEQKAVTQTTIDQPILQKAEKEQAERERERERERDLRNRDREREQRDRDKQQNPSSAAAAKESEIGGVESRRKVKEREKDLQQQQPANRQASDANYIAPQADVASRIIVANRDQQSNIKEEEKKQRGLNESKDNNGNNSKDNANPNTNASGTRIITKPSRSPIDNKRRDRSPNRDNNDDRKYRDVKRPRKDEDQGQSSRFIQKNNQPNNQRK